MISALVADSCLSDLSLSLSLQEVKLPEGMAMIREADGENEKNGKKTHNDPDHHSSRAFLRCFKECNTRKRRKSYSDFAEDLLLLP
jgi:hypothetical protein